MMRLTEFWINKKETGNDLTLAEDYQPNRHVDKDPRETKKLDEVVHK